MDEGGRAVANVIVLDVSGKKPPKMPLHIIISGCAVVDSISRIDMTDENIAEKTFTPWWKFTFTKDL
jgi:hypothetical protein